MNTQHEQDEITPSDDYIKGFNEGYILAMYGSNFSREDMKQTNPTERSKAFEKGMMQYEVEKKFEKKLPFLSKESSNKVIGKENKDVDRDFERD